MITRLANTETIIVVLVVVCALFFIAKKRAQAYWIFSHTAIAAVAVFFLKNFFQRSRPDFIYHYGASGYSFPSGHALMATVLYMSIALYAAGQWFKHSRHKRVYHGLIYFGVTLLIALIGFSRIYLGVHWFSDVLGGCALGIAILATSIVTQEIIKRSILVRSGTNRTQRRI